MASKKRDRKASRRPAGAPGYDPRWNSWRSRASFSPAWRWRSCCSTSSRCFRRRLHPVGRGGRAVQPAEISRGDAARGEAAVLDAVRIFRHAVPGGSAGGGLVSAELAVLPGGHHAARHRVAAGAALPAGGNRRVSAGARSAAQPRGRGVCGHFLCVLRTVRGDTVLTWESFRPRRGCRCCCGPDGARRARRDGCRRWRLRRDAWC